MLLTSGFVGWAWMDLNHRPLPYQIISAGRRASLMADRRPSWLSVSGRYDPRLTSASGTWRARPSDP